MVFDIKGDSGWGSPWGLLVEETGKGQVGTALHGETGTSGDWGDPEGSVTSVYAGGGVIHGSDSLEVSPRRIWL